MAVGISLPRGVVWGKILGWLRAFTYLFGVMTSIPLGNGQVVLKYLRLKG